MTECVPSRQAARWAMSVVCRTLKAFAANDRGATALEYALICGLIVILVVSGIQAVANETIAMYDLITNTIMAAL